MAQLNANTATVTSTGGKVWTNEPVNPETVVRYLCDASVFIDNCDWNEYPAIRFDLANKAIQYWVYPSEALRDSDCQALESEIGPPPSDYLAYWDVTGDGLPDTGTGQGPEAIYVGGSSGTHEADQLYFDQTGVPNPIAAPYDALISVRGLGNPFNMADFDAANGFSLAVVGNWSGPLASEIAANMVGLIGHTNLMQFSKLPFAVSQGLTYGNAIEMRMLIRLRKGGLLSGNSGNILRLPIKTSEGKLNFPRSLDIRNYAINKKGIILHTSLFSTENVVNQGTQDIQVNDSLRWSKKRMASDTTDTVGGTHARFYSDTDSPTGTSLIWSLNLSAAVPRQEIYRSHITGFDIDGFPVYGQPYNVNGIGSTAGNAHTSTWSKPCVVEALTSGGMPVILISKGVQGGVFRTSSILANTGTAAAPNYPTFLATVSIDANLNQCGLAWADTQGRIYLRHFGGGFNRFSRLVYSGANNDATELTTAGNWALEPIGIAPLLTPALGGTGAVAQHDGFACVVNNDDQVNGEPTIYYSDNNNHVVFEITRNANSFGDERDWDWTIIIGQTGVAGNTDGVGTAATLDEPAGMAYLDGFLYIACLGSHTIRRFKTSDSVVDTYFGVVNTPGPDQQFNF